MMVGIDDGIGYLDVRWWMMADIDDGIGYWM